DESRSSGCGISRRHIGTGEIIALEEQGLPGRLRQGIGEAIAEIEPGAMVAAAIVIRLSTRNGGQIGFILASYWLRFQRDQV
ncbi:MAG: hypothetical protein ACREFD_12640, partial [Stellaceae bacterium]